MSGREKTIFDFEVRHALIRMNRGKKKNKKKLADNEFERNTQIKK